MIWRTDALTEEFSHVEDTGNRLLIHCTNARPDKFYTLPQSILRDQVWTEMVLTADLCTEVIAFFGGIIKQMLKGKSDGHIKNSFADSQTRHRRRD